MGLRGDRGLVAAPFKDAGDVASGAVYAFLPSGSTWIEEARLTPHDPGRNAFFGFGLASSGGVALFGAYQDDGVFERSGAVYVFAPLASVTTRNAGSNPASYTATTPVLGSIWTASVDLTTTGHSHAQILGHVSPVTSIMVRVVEYDAGRSHGAGFPQRAGCAPTSISRLRAHESAFSSTGSFD